MIIIVLSFVAIDYTANAMSENNEITFARNQDTSMVYEVLEMPYGNIKTFADNPEELTIHEVPENTDETEYYKELIATCVEDCKIEYHGARTKNLLFKIDKFECIAECKHGQTHVYPNKCDRQENQ